MREQVDAAVGMGVLEGAMALPLDAVGSFLKRLICNTYLCRTHSGDSQPNLHSIVDNYSPSTI